MRNDGDAKQSARMMMKITHNPNSRNKERKMENFVVKLISVETIALSIFFLMLRVRMFVIQTTTNKQTKMIAYNVVGARVCAFTLIKIQTHTIYAANADTQMCEQL